MLPNFRKFSDGTPVLAYTDEARAEMKKAQGKPRPLAATQQQVRQRAVASLKKLRGDVKEKRHYLVNTRCRWMLFATELSSG